MKSFKIFAIVYCLLYFVSCSNHSGKIYSNKSILEIDSLAQSELKDFYCITCIDSFYNSIVYDSLLRRRYSHLQRNSIFNYVNIQSENNHWYRQWLAFSRVPQTCIFNTKTKELVAVIDGASKSSFNQIENKLNNKKDNDNSYYFNYFENINYSELLHAINLVLKAKLKFDQGIDYTTEIDKSLEIVRYPLNLYLKALNAQSMQDDSLSIKCAQELISIKNSFFIRDNQELFLKAKYILDPNMKIVDEPYLSIFPTTLVLQNSKIGENIEFSITLKNSGKKALKITNVYPSCSCVQISNDWKCTIPPQQSISLKGILTPDVEGDLIRDITFISNAINPYSNCTIKVYVTN